MVCKPAGSANKRESGIEILRILCIISIILFHFFNMQIFENSITPRVFNA